MDLLKELRLRQELYVNKREELYSQETCMEVRECIVYIEQALFMLSDKIDEVVYEKTPFFSNNLNNDKDFKWFDDTFSWLLD